MQEQAKDSRLLSLDVFRGMTIAGMVLVNNPGTWSAIYSPLEHAEWNGWTPTDLVFPFFLFIVGIAITFALGKRVETDGKSISLQQWIFTNIYLPLGAPINASLMYAISFILVWLFICWLLYRKQIYIKV